MRVAPAFAAALVLTSGSAFAQTPEPSPGSPDLPVTRVPQRLSARGAQRQRARRPEIRRRAAAVRLRRLRGRRQAGGAVLRVERGPRRSRSCSSTPARAWPTRSRWSTKRRRDSSRPCGPAIAARSSASPTRSRCSSRSPATRRCSSRRSTAWPHMARPRSTTPSTSRSSSSGGPQGRTPSRAARRLSSSPTAKTPRAW